MALTFPWSRTPEAEPPATTPPTDARRAASWSTRSRPPGAAGADGRSHAGAVEPGPHVSASSPPPSTAAAAAPSVPAKPTGDAQCGSDARPCHRALREVRAPGRGAARRHLRRLRLPTHAPRVRLPLVVADQYGRADRVQVPGLHALTRRRRRAPAAPGPQPEVRQTTPQAQGTVGTHRRRGSGAMRTMLGVHQDRPSVRSWSRRRRRDRRTRTPTRNRLFSRRKQSNIATSSRSTRTRASTTTQASQPMVIVTVRDRPVSSHVDLAVHPRQSGSLLAATHPSVTALTCENALTTRPHRPKGPTWPATAATRCASGAPPSAHPRRPLVCLPDAGCRQTPPPVDAADARTPREMLEQEVTLVRDRLAVLGAALAARPFDIELLAEFRGQQRVLVSLLMAAQSSPGRAGRAAQADPAARDPRGA